MWVKVQNYFTPNNGSRGSQPCCGRMDTPASTYSKVHIEFLVRPSTPWGFPHSSVSKESACSACDPGSIPGLGRSPGEGNGNPLQYSCLETPLGRGAWWATVHRVAGVGHNLATTPPPPQVTANLESLSHSQLHPSKNTCLILTQSLT